MKRIVFPEGTIDITPLVLDKFKTIAMIIEDCPDGDIPVVVTELDSALHLLYFAEHGTFSTTNYNDLINIALSADFFNYKEGMDEAIKQIAECLNGKDPEFIRRILTL
jgi:hypothetical protein